MLRRLKSRFQTDPRYGRMLHGAASAFAGRGFGLLISLVSLPLTVHYLGKLEYGIWTTINTSIAMLSLLDLGIANSLTNLISDAYAEGSPEKAQQSYATAFWSTVLLVLVLAPICFAAWTYIDWGSVFRLHDATLIAQTRACVGISALYFLLLLPLNLANKVLGGYQQVHLTNYAAMVGNIFGLIALLCVVYVKGSIVALAAAFCTAGIFSGLALNLWLYFGLKPWVKPYPRKARASIAKLILGQGFLFFVLQLTGLVVYNSDNLVIAHYLGASEVTPYSVAWKLVSYAALLQALFIPSLWPAFTEAYRKQDLAWVRRVYQSITRKSLIAVGLVALMLAVVGRIIIRVWIGAAAVPSSSLLWLMALFAVTSSATTNQAILLTATGRLRLEAGAAVIASGANLAGTIYMVQRIGAQGVILSTIISFSVFILIPQTWEVRRVLSGHYLLRAHPEPVLHSSSSELL